MTRLLAAAILTAAALAIPPASSAQAAPAGNNPPLAGPAAWSISGTILSASSGTALDRAEVTLFTSGPNGSQLGETVTAQDGSFRFDHLQAGTYSIQAWRRGYIAAGYQEHDGFTTGIVTGPSLVTSGLRVTLYPTGVLYGAITDDSGEPVPGAQVHLFRQDQRTGQLRILRVATDTTDDTGTFEFDSLRAGTFFLSASAQPWYAFHPSAKTDATGTLLPADQQPTSPLDLAYPTIYYENSTDSDSATPIAIAAGDHVEANISLHAVPAIHIQIHLPPPTEGRGVPMPQLMQSVFGSDEFQPAQEFTAPTRSGGMVADLSGIAPGHYVLRQFGPPSQGNRTATVNLTSDQSLDFASASNSGVDVTGKIAMASGAPLPPKTHVNLMPADQTPARPGDAVAADGTFTFRSVPPGRYAIQAVAPDTRLAVQQMMASGAEVHGATLTIAAQPVLIAATLARGATTLSGFAKQNGQPTGGVMILLVPHDPAARDLYRRDQSNTDGSFTLNNVVPGDYSLLAIDNGWTLDWARPEVLAPYLTRGMRVRVAGQRTMNLPSPVEVQPR
ncbi:MAG: carboxypeptidase regulatory-like domain-containing protein [Acidobacteriota bacterium]